MKTLPTGTPMWAGVLIRSGIPLGPDDEQLERDSGGNKRLSLSHYRPSGTYRTSKDYPVDFILFVEEEAQKIIGQTGEIETIEQWNALVALYSEVAGYRDREQLKTEPLFDKKYASMRVIRELLGYFHILRVGIVAYAKQLQLVWKGHEVHALSEKKNVLAGSDALFVLEQRTKQFDEAVSDLHLAGLRLKFLQSHIYPLVELIKEIQHTMETLQKICGPDEKQALQVEAAFLSNVVYKVNWLFAISRRAAM